MNCPDCRDRLQQWFDARASDAPPALCPTCAEWDVAVGRLEQGLRHLAAPAPPTDLTDRIIARNRTARRRRVRLRFAAGFVAAAATLLFAVWFSFPVRQPLRREVIPPLVKAPEPAPPVASVNLRDSVAEAGSAMASLTTRTADETVAKTKALLPVVVDPSFGKVDAAPKSPRGTGDSVTAGLEPVADSARRAVSLFFRELPPMEAAPKTGF